MKEITSHHVGVHTDLKIFNDSLNNGIYQIYNKFGLMSNVRFQLGNPNEVGFNGVTNEALLAIVRDRLIAFQSSEFACIENQQALVHVDEALEVLKRRTRDRITRKVEGTHIV